MNAVFALGSNSSGQLGIGHMEDVSVPKPVQFAGIGKDGRGLEPLAQIPRVVQVAAGGNHTLLLTTGGEIYWAGESSTGSCGQVSHGSTASTPAFRKANLFGGGEAEQRQNQQNQIQDQNHNQRSNGGLQSSCLQVRQVAATWEASIIATYDNRERNSCVYSCGCGTKGELGQGPFIVRLPSIQRIPDFPPAGTEVTDLAACMGHVVAVLSNGDAYGWGNGRKGQLGAPDAIVDEPRKIQNIGFKVAKAACGKDFTCLVGDPATGEVLLLGPDRFGIRTSAPPAIPGWKDVQASWGGLYVLHSDGTLSGWGRNDHGQLPPEGLPKLSQIAAGSEHLVAVTGASDVIAWGWGEHGNCGPQVLDGDVRGRWNVIASHEYAPPSSRFETIGAGCATSWIILRTLPTGDSL